METMNQLETTLEIRPNWLHGEDLFSFGIDIAKTALLLEKHAETLLGKHLAAALRETAAIFRESAGPMRCNEHEINITVIKYFLMMQKCSFCSWIAWKPDLSHCYGHNVSVAISEAKELFLLCRQVAAIDVDANWQQTAFAGKHSTYYPQWREKAESDWKEIKEINDATP